MFYGTLGYGQERNGALGNILNTYPMALKHLMPALMHFYIGMYIVNSFFETRADIDKILIEVEQTGASSQFYDKFSK